MWLRGWAGDKCLFYLAACLQHTQRGSKMWTQHSLIKHPCVNVVTAAKHVKQYFAQEKKKRAELIYLLLISFCSLYTKTESVCQGKCTNCNSLSLEIKHFFPCLCLHLSLSLSTSGPLLLSVTNTSGFNRKEIQNVSHCLIVTHHPNLQPPRSFSVITRCLVHFNLWIVSFLPVISLFCLHSSLFVHLSMFSVWNCLVVIDSFFLSTHFAVGNSPIFLPSLLARLNCSDHSTVMCCHLSICPVLSPSSPSSQNLKLYRK